MLLSSEEQEEQRAGSHSLKKQTHDDRETYISDRPAQFISADPQEACEASVKRSSGLAQCGRTMTDRDGDNRRPGEPRNQGMLIN